MSIDPPVDWPTIGFPIVVPSVDRPVDQDWIQRAELSGRSTGARSREQSSLDGRLPRSTGPKANWPCTFVHIGRPVQSTDVHKRARSFRLEGRLTVPVDRPESSALWIWPWSTRRSTGRELCSLYPGLDRPGGRPVAQWSEI